MGLTAVCGSTTRHPAASNSTPPASERAILLDVIRVSIIYPDPQGAGTNGVLFSPQRRRGAEISAEKTTARRGRIPPFCQACFCFSALISASLRLCGEATYGLVVAQGDDRVHAIDQSEMIE